MSGELISHIIEDARTICNGEFSTELTITPPGGSSYVINGIITRHSQNFDTEGLPIIAENSHVLFSEKDLTDAGATVRDANGNILIDGWKVEFIDAISQDKYQLREPGPDRTIGLIRSMLIILE